MRKYIFKLKSASPTELTWEERNSAYYLDKDCLRNKKNSNEEKLLPEKKHE